MEKINPEIAAHNIATIFSEKFLDMSNSNTYLNPDSNELYEKSKKAAKLYALVYDEVFKEISSENKEA
ncbi:hypothetical protein DSECCO2_488680 [anaerobic digester metagenome]